MEQTDITYLGGGKLRLQSLRDNGHLPQLKCANISKGCEDIDRMDTFWQETILDFNTSDDDLQDDKIHQNCNVLDKEALTRSWVASHVIPNPESQREQLHKSRSLEHADFSEYNGNHKHYHSSNGHLLARCTVSDSAVNPKEEEYVNTLHTDELPCTRNEYRNRHSAFSRTTNLNDEFVKINIMSQRYEPGAPTVLPDLTTNKKVTALSPLCFDERLPRSEYSPGQSLTSSPGTSPGSTPQRHRQVHNPFQNESFAGISSTRGGVQSLPSSPRVPEKGKLIFNDYRKGEIGFIERERSLIQSTLAGSLSPTTSRRCIKGTGIKRNGQQEIKGTRSVNDKAEKCSNRPDTPLFKLISKPSRSLGESIRMYSSCSDLPEVQED